MYFQNPFGSDFYGVWLLSDRQYNVDFKCPRNTGRGDELVVSWGVPPFDLSSNDSDGSPRNVLTISYSLNDPLNWSDLPITISAASIGATLATEVASSMSASSRFNDLFTVTVGGFDKDNNTMTKLTIKQIKPVTQMKFYIKNTGAETVLKFNQKAGVAALPTYFERHTIVNRFTYPDSTCNLVLLDTTLNVDSAIITAAGLNPSSVAADYKLLNGRSGLFTSTKNTVDTSSRITQTLTYPSGAEAGDMAKKITYSYTGSKTAPDTILEEPYVLSGGDLL